ncbi:MAG: FTR1 family protein [Acidimicrobiales bacterium]
MLAAFVIFLREGTEASIIVAILCSYLDRTGQRRHFRDVFVGVGLAAGLAAGGGFAAYYTIHSYSGSRVQTIFETATYLVAVVVLTYMTFWMRRHARSMSRDLASRAEGALGRRERYGLGLLAFQAVGREGLETAVFTLAIVFAAGTHGTLLGAAGGLACALAFSFAVFRLGRRVNLGIFFTVVGTVLMVFAAGLVADSVENLQQLGWVHVLSGHLWDTSRQLSEGSSIGDVFHSLVGYADQPTALQLIAYLAYAVSAVTVFVTLSRRDARARRVGAVAPARAAGGAS